MSQALSESEWIVLVTSFLKAGDGMAAADERLAWEDFYHTYDPIIRSRIRRIHSEWNLVNDLSQEVWAVLVKRLPRLRVGPDAGSVAGWIVKITDDMARKHAWRRSKSAVQSLSSQMADELPDPDLVPDVEDARLQRDDELQWLIDSLGVILSERDHRIVVLRLRGLRTVVEIARDLGLAEKCVSSALHRATVKLRDLLDRKGSGVLPTRIFHKNEKHCREL
jgi:RNA polymerase sigma factor (sigma-70 family)